nr:hypothetical protein [Tanacetum cinerariifolium]
MEGNMSTQRSDEQRNLYNALVDAYEADKTILDSYGETAILKRRREDDDDQEGPSAGSNRGSKRRREGGEPESACASLEPITKSAGRSITGSKSRQASASESAFAEEPMHTTSQMEGNKSIQRSDEQRNLYNALVDAYEADKTILDSYGETAILKRRHEDDDDQEGPSAGSNRGSKRRREGGEPESACASLEPITKSAGRSITGSKSRQASASESAFAEEPMHTTSQVKNPHIWCLKQQAVSHSSFNELLDTPLDFSNFIMNRLGVNTLTPELLARPTYELMRGSCNSLTELEYHFEKVYKATTDQLDWVNPEDNQGRRVILFAHFINNDLEYLRGDLVPHTMWIQEPINYDKYALWGVSHWGRKRQQFYGFAVNRESALDVYSKRRVIAVTDLKIME